MRGAHHMAVWIGILGTAGVLAGEPQAERSPSDGLVPVGTWLVHITGRDCDTGLQSAPEFQSVMTFTRDGAFFEQSGLRAFAPGQRTDGMGQWQRDAGLSVTVRSAAVIAFETPPTPPMSPGFLAGWSTLSQTVELIDSDRFTSRATSTFYDANAVAYRTTGCVIAEGQRFE